MSRGGIAGSGSGEKHGGGGHGRGDSKGKAPLAAITARRAPPPTCSYSLLSAKHCPESSRKFLSEDAHCAFCSVCVRHIPRRDRQRWLEKEATRQQGHARYLANVFEKDLKRIKSLRVAPRASPTHYLKCTLVLALLVVDLRELVQVCGQSTHTITVMQPTSLSCTMVAASFPCVCHASGQRRGRTWPARRQGDAPESFAPGRQMIFSPKKDAVGSMFLSSAARTCLWGRRDGHAIPHPHPHTSHVHTCRRHRAALFVTSEARSVDPERYESSAAGNSRCAPASRTKSKQNMRSPQDAPAE